MRVVRTEDIEFKVTVLLDLGVGNRPFSRKFVGRGVMDAEHQMERWLLDEGLVHEDDIGKVRFLGTKDLGWVFKEVQE